MFGNLVHIAYLRLLKSRAFVIGIFVSITTGLVFSFAARTLLTYIVVDYVDESEPLNIYTWQEAFWMVFCNVCWIFMSFNVLFAVCDYYKYRQLINIEGAVRSRTKLTLSEVGGMWLFSMTLAVIPMFAVILGSVFDDSFLLFREPFKFIGVYCATVCVIFGQSFPVFFLSKLFRRKSLATIMFILYVFIKSVVYYTLITLVAVSSSDAGEPQETIDFIQTHISLFFNPENILAGKIMDGVNVSFWLIIAAIIAEFSIWTILSVLASKRKYEL